ncbi:MAG: hypothetical protein ACE5IL_03125 [Myxococcota bacterium]
MLTGRAFRTPLAGMLVVAFALSCAHRPPDVREVVPRDLQAPQSGRLAVIWQIPDDEDELHAELFVYDAKGAEPIPMAGASEVRWTGPDSLLLALDAISEDPSAWGASEIVSLELAPRALRRLLPARRWFNLEPSPDRRWLAIGEQLDDRGESEIQVRFLGRDLPVVARRRFAGDEPRWSPDGRELVVARTLQDPDAPTNETSASLGGVGLAWPRLFRLRRDLVGPRSPIADGAPGEPLVAGGTLPLWWDSRGIWARQRRGLVRCEPARDAREVGCHAIYDPGPGRRVLDGRPLGRSEALLLVLDTASDERLASEIHTVDLERGLGLAIVRAPQGVYVSDLDWTPAETSGPSGGPGT